MNRIRSVAPSSFKHRLLILIVALIGIAEGATVVLALGYVSRDVRHTAERDLLADGVVVQRQLDLRQARMAATAEVLVSDFGFKEAVASADVATLRSALSNQADRIGASFAVLFSREGAVEAATQALTPVVVKALLPPEPQDGQTFFAVIDGRAVQVVVTSLRAPEPSAWVAFAFRIDDAQEQNLSALVRSQVLLQLHAAKGTEQTAAAGANAAAEAAAAAGAAATGGSGVRVVEQQRRTYLSLTLPLPTRGGAVNLVLRRPLGEVMAAYRKVRDALLGIAAIALAAAGGVAWLVGRSAARPVELLAAAVRRIEAGDYDEPVRVQGPGEFVQLADSFNGMQIGLREREEHIRHQATHDALTGLLSRAGLREQLAAQLRAGRQAAALLLDLHRFRDINASLGRETADHLLLAVAERLRRQGGGSGLAARFGADQFALVMDGAEANAAAAEAADIAAELRQGLGVGHLRVPLTARIGISTTASGPLGADDLLRQADMALLAAKERGIECLCYDAGHDAQHRRGVLLVAELRRALAADQLAMAYQPIVRVTNGELVQFEALVRWTHPTLGVISPAEFVPLAERSAIIADLTRWVIAAVIGQLGRWAAAGYRAQVALNLSASDVSSATLPAYILAQLAQRRVAPEQLLFEVTESAIMRDASAAVNVMQQLRAAGCRFAVDDFGTGHSSLAQLHTLPVEELKIDRAFISDLVESERSALIVRTTVELGHGLGMVVVGEGVETPEGWTQLLRLGCDLAQGYLIARPMRAADVLGWVKARRQAFAEVVSRADADGQLIELTAHR